MAPCFLCASLQVNQSKAAFASKAEAEGHATQHFLQTKIFDEACISLDQMFEQCFPDFDALPLMKKKVVKKEGRKALLQLCHTLFDGRISTATPRVTCQKCGTGIIVYKKRQGRQYGFAINHASVHLRIDLFECRKCGRSFASRSIVERHLPKVHRLRCLREYYVDKSDNFLDQITSSIKECFAEVNNGASDEKAPRISLMDESSVRSMTKGSKLAVERHLFCYKLIRQPAGANGKIQCRLCSKKIVVKQRAGRYKCEGAMEHALVHLKRPFFRCAICSSAHGNRVLMYVHLKSAHALPMSTNYTCLADEFHDETMSMLKKCYADESDK